MCGWNIDSALFYRYINVRRILYSILVSGTIFASFNIQAEVLSAISKYTLQREKTTDVILTSPQQDTVPEIEVFEHNGAYQIKAVAIIDAPARYVRHVLKDYRHIYRLNPSIIESEVLKQHEDGSVSVRTKVIGCAAYFCEELNRVERVQELPSGDLYAEIIPELSQFKSGQTLWRINTLGEHCEVNYIADMEPDVFIPPVVGKFLLKKSIREEMKASFENLEKISGILAEREWQESYQPVRAEYSHSEPCMNLAEDSLDAAD